MGKLELLIEGIQYSPQFWESVTGRAINELVGPIEGEAAILKKNEACSNLPQGNGKLLTKVAGKQILGQHKEEFSNKLNCLKIEWTYSIL